MTLTQQKEMQERALNMTLYVVSESVIKITNTGRTSVKLSLFYDFVKSFILSAVIYSVGVNLRDGLSSRTAASLPGQILTAYSYVLNSFKKLFYAIDRRIIIMFSL